MDSPCELTIECKPHLQFDETWNLEEFVSRLEDEHRKIEAFKRELPLCMQLLADAMEASRQHLQTRRSKLVLEEFIPIKKGIDSSESDVTMARDRSNWMASGQLWNQETEKSPHEAEIKFSLDVGKSKIIGIGAFHPFDSKDKPSSSQYLGLPELALVSNHDNRSSPDNKREGSVNTKTTQRKARRCWSPDLHRRFVQALQMLGGSQVATPKQIREVMKVEGLTNDEVKSHLQKYRLHTRRPSPAPQATAAAPPQVVVLGGIWFPSEYAAATTQGGAPAAALYGAPPQPFYSPAATTPQEMYPTVAPPPPSVGHKHLINNSPLTHLSPESDAQRGGNGNPPESIEDRKSESGNWKADIGMENPAERKREECNTSIISLKF